MVMIFQDHRLNNSKMSARSWQLSTSGAHPSPSCRVNRDLLDHMIFPRRRVKVLEIRRLSFSR